MDQYLQLCRCALSDINQFKKISIVIGNESCDLDSVVSAIVLAYIKYHELTALQTENDSEVIVIPLLNVLREDLRLRREVVFWFEQVLQFDLQWLICRDEVNFDDLNSSSAQLLVSLVDHNDNKEIARLLPRAQFDEIVDHHKRYSEGDCQVNDPSKIKIDPTVGSCSSLVALRFFKSNINHKFGDSAPETYDSQIALILYGPILLDTICFSHSAKRFNAKDYEAVNKVEDVMKHPTDSDASLFDRNEVYQRLVDAKNSLDGLSFSELLRKDMKIVESVSDNNLAICISSITGTLLTELSLKDNIGELKAFSECPPTSVIFSESRPRLFNAIVLMSLDNRIPNNLRRQLALYCTNKHLIRTIATCIERSELELELITAAESLRTYNQNNLTASRKVVLPIISTILNGPGNQSQRSNDENGKRSENGGGDSMSSAPNSFVQQPDSYYGSFIDDSFVGEFVGDYLDPSNDPENILVMDADGQNLVMMNPTDTSCISHTHEIEFDFDSFGPESIIYAGNVEAINGKANGGELDQENGHSTPPDDGVASKEHQVVYEEQNCHQSSTDEIIDCQVNEQIPRESENDTAIQPTELPEISLNNSESLPLEGDTEQVKSELLDRSDLNVEEPKRETETENALGNLSVLSNSSFSRNNTLTRSQRRKVVPKVTIKDLVLANDPFTPPAMEPPMGSPLKISQTRRNSDSDNIDQNENFIVSSSNIPQAETSSNFQTSQETSAQSKPVITDPLSVHNLNADSLLNSSNIGGLYRQPSVKKKVPVNFDVILHGRDISNDSRENVKPKEEGVPDPNHIRELSAEEEYNEERAWRQSLPLGNGEIRHIDMKVIEPYKKVISHGGYMHACANGRNIEGSSPAIIIFSACFLPDRSRKDYHYVMDNLFLYVLTTLHNMIADDYILIYLHNGGSVQNGSGSTTTANNMPTFSWLKRCYQMIDRKLKKNLKGLYLVHPTFWLKTLIIMSKPFISSKFARKIRFVRSLDELREMIPIEDVAIPDPVKIYDQLLTLQVTSL